MCSGIHDQILNWGFDADISETLKAGKIKNKYKTCALFQNTVYYFNCHLDYTATFWLQ